MAPIVTVRPGQIRGRTLDSGVHEFLGVPYAAPTDGPGRFRPARPRVPWSGIRECTEPGPVCPQRPPGRVPQSEDCLNLDVWTPDLAGGLPVLLYVPGGGYVTGNASAGIIHGARLARRDVVVVTVNYRLHALGFLDLGGEHDPNHGLLDVVSALEWVRDNVGAFGGDPDRITISGYSAGGNTVASMLAMPRVGGQVRRAVIHDGAGTLNLSRASTGTIAGHLLELLAVDSDDRRRLEALPVRAVLDAADEINAIYSNVMPTGTGVKPEHDRRKGLKWSPAPGPDLPAAPVDALRSGSARGVDLLIGTMAESMDLVATRYGTVDESSLASYLGDHVSTERTLGMVIDVYRRHRADATIQDVFGSVLTDLLLMAPTVRTAEAQLAHDDAVYVYECTIRDARTGRATHGVDTGLWFGNPPRELGDDHPTVALADHMASWLSSFIAHGVPVAEGAPDWQRYDTASRPVMRIGEETAVVFDPHRERRELWSDAVLP